MECQCILSVDLHIFRGVFTAQWLHGRQYKSCESLFFCTACGPVALQEDVDNPAKGNGKDDKKIIRDKGKLGTRFKNFFRGLSTSEPAKKLDENGALHSRIASTSVSLAEDEELPVTPRSKKELFLCVTCGTCYCRQHAGDHHYSRREVEFPPDDGTAQDYPYHSFFIGVPSFISTHPQHHIPETKWGLLFPTVTVNEIEKGKLDLSHPYPFYHNIKAILDEAMFTLAGAGAGYIHSSRPSGATFSDFMKGRQEDGCNDAAVPSSTSPIPEQTHVNTHMLVSPTPSGASTFLHAVATDDVLLPKPEFFLPSDWGFVVWCAKCTQRAARVSGKRYDNDIPWQRHMRRLGQQLALLSYFAHSGIRLELPDVYHDYLRQKQLMQTQKQQRYRQMLGENQRVGKASEIAACVELNTKSPTTFGYLNRFGACAGSLEISRIDTDRILSRCALSGFSNSTYIMCYFNTVVQCVLRCNFFAVPIMQLDTASIPGKLSLSMKNLMTHLAHQTYQDVRNGASHAFARAVYRQVCKISSIFEEDEQQDAQELFLCLINGIADEFDNDKSAEAKAKSKRISFEGVMRTEVKCSVCNQKVPRDEMFMAVSIPVAESIEEGFRSLFQTSYLTGKDRYACENCFKMLGADEQTAHNATAKEQQAERKRIAALSSNKGTKPLQPERQWLYENCVYQDAEVNTQMTQLGGSLAVHLLRFHYDATQQDFIKITSHVSIPLQLDLTPYVSDAVRQNYERISCLQKLRRQFSDAHEEVIASHHEVCNRDYSATTKILIKEGYGMDRVMESSMPGDELASELAYRLDSEPSVAPISSPVTVEGSEVGQPLPESNWSSLVSTTQSLSTQGNPSKTPKWGTHSMNGNEPQHHDPVTRAAYDGGHLSTNNTETCKGSGPPISALFREDFEPFDQTRGVPSLVRQLVGIVTHHGSLHGGHYIAYVRYLSQPHVWFRCDDEEVTIVKEQTVLECSNKVYLAFYE